ncbi:MAG: glycosyltransferase family 2 protein [Candidatus Sericytochromatia bacterium]
MLISLIIPHYNRFELLQRCLSGLRQQSSGDFEILLVDDGSDQAPPAWLQDWIRHWPRLRWLPLARNSGRAAARNTGLEAARGELVIFLDCDMAVQSDFVAAHRRFHLQRGASWIGQGRIIGTQDPDAWPLPSIWTDASRAHFATGNVSVERTILLRLGGFDPAFSAYGFEDLELGFRLAGAGWHSAAVADAESWHYEPLPTAPDWERDLAKERERGRGAALFYRKHPCLEVRLLAQLTPLHPLLDQLPRLGGLISDARWLSWIEALQQRHPKLALALYRGLLNRYCVQATRAALARPDSD